MKKIVSVTTACMIAACAPNYTSPSGTSAAVEKEVIIDAPFDQTWRTMVEYLGSSFFSIDNLERTSGLMTLSFGAGQPGRFIDCGYVEATNLSGEAGPFVQLAEISPTAVTDFAGRMSLVMRPMPDRQTRLTVNTRYVYQVRTDAWGNTWAFDSQGSDTKPVVAGFNTYPVTCRPTGEAERSILQGVPAPTQDVSPSRSEEQLVRP